MDTLSLDTLTNVSLRALAIRHRRVLITIIAAMLAVGAFLEWGPIGLGNGPLYMGMNGDGFGEISSRLPVGIVTPIDNSGGSAVVIDAVQLLGNGRYPAPHVLAMGATSNSDCGYLFSGADNSRGIRP